MRKDLQLKLNIDAVERRAISVVECELCFSLGLKPHSVACGEILSPYYEQEIKYFNFYCCVMSLIIC